MSAAQPIGVLGAGAWGTALAQMLSSDGRAVTLWARESEVVEQINRERRNSLFLPSARLNPTIRAASDLGALGDCAIVLAVTPAQHLRATLEQMAGHGAQPPRDLVLCSKGIEAQTGQLMNEVARETMPQSAIAVLSGPTFAHEVAAGLPTAVTLACGAGEAQWQRLSRAIARAHFRPYYSDDVVGAEIGGAVKNVLAIACGVAEGLTLGQNARAALIARGYSEMVDFGCALGARRETLAGLCGLGDLVLTCSSTSSRNFSAGKALAQGTSAGELMADRRTVAEGVHTAPVLERIARENQVAMPIVSSVCEILGGADPARVVERLLARPLKSEAGERAR